MRRNVWMIAVIAVGAIIAVDLVWRSWSDEGGRGPVAETGIARKSSVATHATTRRALSTTARAARLARLAQQRARQFLDVTDLPGRTTSLAPGEVEPAATTQATELTEARQAIAVAALPFVGRDADANAAWTDAINDATISPDMRRFLIEDLIAEGFSDPANIRPDELPLVTARLQLIEQFGPQAIDDTNAAAFAEAYAELLDVYQRLTAPPPAVDQVMDPGQPNPPPEDQAPAPAAAPAQ